MDDWTVSIMNNIVMNISIQVVVSMFSIHLGIYLGMKLLGHIIILCLALWVTVKHFSKVATQFTFPLTMCECFSFSTSLLILVIAYLFFPFEKLCPFSLNSDFTIYSKIQYWDLYHSKMHPTCFLWGNEYYDING